MSFRRVLSLLVLLILLGVWSRQTDVQVVQADCVQGKSVDQTFFADMLVRMNISVSDLALTALRYWQQAENTAACWNPLATTLPMPGSWDFNSAGVKNYPDRATGIQATANTLLYTPSGTGTAYKAIREFLAQKSFDRQALQSALNTWSGNGGYVPNLLNRWEQLWNNRGNTATVTDIPNPDAYTCSQPGYVGFESFPEGTNLSSGTISGVQFTTTNAFTWVVGDFATGFYNGKYPNGGYTSHGTHWAWLGVSQGAGRIDFPKGPASYFSLLVSDYYPVSLDAYDASGNLLATAGPSPNNYNTGHMTELKITRATADMAYVIVHDNGNYFEIDDVCTNAPATPNTIRRVVDQTHFMQTGQHASGSFIVDFVTGAKQFLHIFLGPFFSDVDLILTRPDGSIVSPSDPGVIYDKTANSVEVSIDDAPPGEWQYEIVANQLDAGGENIHIIADQETIIVPNAPPTLTLAGDQTVQYSDYLTFGISASDPDIGDALTLNASGLPSALTFTDNGDGTGTVTGTAQVTEGTYNVTFSANDGFNPPVSAGVDIVVTKEDALLAYTGDALVTAGSPVALKASVAEEADGSPGDMTNAAVFFDVTAGIGGGTTSYGPVPVSAGGEAMLTFAGGLPANLYSVDVRMDPANGYYQAPPAQTAALVVYDPSAGFTTGGGWVMDGGEHGNFGFSVKYAGRGANIQGQALYVYRDGDTVTRVKSNAMQWLVISGNTAIFRGKATANGVGNHTFEIRVADNGGGSSDTFAIKIWRPDGTLLHEVVAAALGGGDVIVPHP